VFDLRAILPVESAITVKVQAQWYWTTHTVGRQTGWASREDTSLDFDYSQFILCSTAKDQASEFYVVHEQLEAALNKLNSG